MQGLSDLAGGRIDDGHAAWTWARDDDGAWSPLGAWERGTGLAMPSLGLALTWDEVYGGVGLG